MVRKMLLQRQEYLVKQCIRNGTVFDTQDSAAKKIRFSGRAALQPVEDRSIKLVDFVHIMLEQKWSSGEIEDKIYDFCKKGKLES